MVNKGDLAPDFTLLSDEGKELSLSDYRGQRVILFFYPKADTPGCTIQACGFRDQWPKIEASNATVLGVSPDTPEDLAAWRKKESLPYTLLSDPDHQVADRYGVWGEKNSFGRSYEGIIRSHFVIDELGRLADVQRNISPQKSVEQGVALL